MPSKGVARVREANLKLGVVRIVLKSGEQVSLRIDEAQRLTQPLSADHFLSRTMSDAGELSRIGSKDPGELLRLLFASIKRETSLVELKDMLSPVIPDAQWNPWWASIRKDPRLIVGSGTKPIINWNDSVSDGNTALMAKFLEASAYDKLEMFKKHAKRSETLAAGMIQALMGEATNASESDPSLALEIIFSLPESDTDDGTMPSGVSDLLGRGDTPKTIAGVKDKSIRKKAMQCALRSREDWPSIYRALFATETDNTLFKLLYDTLRSKGHDALLDEDVERAISDPSESPRFFLWLCKEMQDRSELLKRANWDFLRSLMNTLDHPAFKGHYPALRKLFDPGEIVDRVIETLDASTARSLLDALSRDRELEDYRKEDVRRKLFTHFPELQENKKQGWFVTKEGIEKKRLEFEKLVKEEIPHNTREIQRTREFGDLRENFEYHAARRRQEMLSSRAKTLHDELVTTRAIDPETVDTSKISIGTRVRLAPKDGAAAAVTLTILGPWDSDPATNILSYTSAAGAALLNAPKGSAVTFNDAGYLVEDIAVWTS
jgi:transcription elongation GreA/GreB family factor